MKKGAVLLAMSLMAGCAIVKNEVPTEEKFMNGITLDDGRIVYTAFDVKYNNAYLMELLRDKEINIDDYINKLEMVEEYRDGGTKLYKYNEKLKFSGLGEYYVLNCNSLDNIKNVYIAKNKDNLEDLCALKIDDIAGVSMEIKKGTLSNKGATVVITDVSDRKNIYGSAYFVESYSGEVWVKLSPKIDMVFTDQAFYPDENNRLELDIDWLTYYGRLKKGKYRIVKTTSIEGEGVKHFITSEFEIK